MQWTTLAMSRNCGTTHICVSAVASATGRLSPLVNLTRRTPAWQTSHKFKEWRCVFVYVKMFSTINPSTQMVLLFICFLFYLLFMNTRINVLQFALQCLKLYICWACKYVITVNESPVTLRSQWAAKRDIYKSDNEVILYAIIWG